MVDQDALKSIEDLHRLKTQGVISEADYEKAKEQLLFGKPHSRQGAGTIRSTARSTTTPTVEPFAFSDLNPNTAELLGWITLPLKRYADFEGRSSRKEFWMFQLIFLALGVLGLAALGSFGEGDGTSHILLAFVVMATLGLLIPQLAVQARRMHDQDRSGWLVLLNFVPYVGGLIVLVFMLLEGTPGENRFGPDPKRTDGGTHTSLTDQSQQG